MRSEIFKTSHLVFPFLLLVISFYMFHIQSFLPLNGPVEYTLKSSSSFHVTMRFRSVPEQGNGENPPEVIVPLPASIYPFQRVENTVIYPEPLRIVALRGRSKGAVFSLRSSGDREPDITVSYDITLFHTVFPIDLTLPGKIKYSAGSDECLESLPWICSDDYVEKIQKLAGEITAGEEISYYKVVRIYEYIHKHFSFRERPEPRSVRECLADLELQCCDATLLFVSLCRASGIPARFYSGLFISKDFFYFPQTHSWSQVFTEDTGWIPVDVTLGRFDDRSRFLCLGEQRASYIQLWEGETRFVLPGGEQTDGRPCPLLISMDVYPSSAEVVITGDRIAPVAGRESCTIRSLVREVHSEKAWELYGKALTNSDVGARDKAIELLEEAVKDSPDFSQAHRDLIQCYSDSGKEVEITLRYDELFKRNPSPLNKYYSGVCRLVCHRYGEALRLFGECEQEGYASSELYTSLGFLYLRTKQLREAEKAFNRALGAEGEHFAAYSNLILMFQDAEVWGAMLYWAEEASREYPLSSVFQGQAGYGLIRLGKPKEALQYIKKALEMEPSMGWYHGLAGWAQRDIGFKESARKELDLALKLKRGISNLDYYKRMRIELKNE